MVRTPDIAPNVTSDLMKRTQFHRGFMRHLFFLAHLGTPFLKKKENIFSCSGSISLQVANAQVGAQCILLFRFFPISRKLRKSAVVTQVTFASPVMAAHAYLRASYVHP